MYGWQTQERSAVPWADVPPANKRLMVKTVTRLIHERAFENGAEMGRNQRMLWWSNAYAWAEACWYFLRYVLWKLHLTQSRPTSPDAHD